MITWPVLVDSVSFAHSGAVAQQSAGCGTCAAAPCAWRSSVVLYVFLIRRRATGETQDGPPPPPPREGCYHRPCIQPRPFPSPFPFLSFSPSLSSSLLSLPLSPVLAGETSQAAAGKTSLRQSLATHYSLQRSAVRFCVLALLFAVPLEPGAALLQGLYEGTYKWSYKWLDSVKKMVGL